LLIPTQNYKVYCTLNNIAVDESIVDAAVEDAGMGDKDVDMDVDDDAGDEELGDADEDEDMPTFFKDLKDDEASKEAAKTPSRNPKSKVALVVRAKVLKVLTTTGLSEKRARQCDQNDFLKMLLGRSPTWELKKCCESALT
jgi:18S rRNA (adenine1779-N6/adenine1780-N6)-dimethyltransferase